MPAATCPVLVWVLLCRTHDVYVCCKPCHGAVPRVAVPVEHSAPATKIPPHTPSARLRRARTAPTFSKMESIADDWVWGQSPAGPAVGPVRDVASFPCARVLAPPPPPSLHVLIITECQCGVHCGAGAACPWPDVRGSSAEDFNRRLTPPSLSVPPLPPASHPVYLIMIVCAVLRCVGVFACACPLAAPPSTAVAAGSCPRSRPWSPPRLFARA